MPGTYTDRMAWLIVVAVVVGLLALAAWSDRRDRRAGFTVRSAADIGSGVRAGKQVARETKRARESQWKQGRQLARSRRSSPADPPADPRGVHRRAGRDERRP